MGWIRASIASYDHEIRRLWNFLPLRKCSEHCSALFEKLRRQSEELLTFLLHPGVEATNNHAERQIRFAVIMGKNYFGNRSMRGAEAQAILKSAFHTCHLRGVDPIVILAESVPAAFELDPLADPRFNPNRSSWRNSPIYVVLLTSPIHGVRPYDETPTQIVTSFPCVEALFFNTINSGSGEIPAVTERGRPRIRSTVTAEGVSFQGGAVRPDRQHERRIRPRIQGPISARVRGIDVDGGEFDSDAVVRNMSATGLYLRLGRQVAKSARLSFLIWLPPGVDPGESGLRLTASGIVRRVEPSADETCGLGVEFKYCRKLYD